MNILHINSYFAAGKFYKNLYDEQIKDGLDIDVFVPVPSSFKKTGFDYGEYTTICKNHGRYDRYIFHLKHNKVYKDIINKYDIKKYLVLHAHSLFSNGYIAMKLNQDFGIPYMVAVRNTDVNLFFKKLFYLKRTGIKILSHAQSIVFLSRAYRDEVIETYLPEKLKELMYKKSVIIPNGLDDFWFKNINNGKQISDKNDLNLLYAGVVSKNKNITTTVKAIEILRNKGCNVNFTVVGKVKDKNIFNQIKNLSYINYISFQPKEALLQIYRDNDIFVMPSITETFGLVYAEALSQGLPVIYTRRQGFDGQFEDGEVGYSVNCFDAGEIANKIACIINNYNSISKTAIIKSRKFDWSILAEDYKEVYKKCVY